MKSHADRSQLNVVFDDLARHGFSAAELSPVLAAPLPAVERELRRATARQDRHRPVAAGCTAMIAFPDTSDAWQSGDDSQSSALLRPRALRPWKYETLEEARIESEQAAGEAESAA